MLALWNNGIEKLSHVVRAGENPEEQRPRLVREFVQWIVTQLMHVDSCPTLSRFFTYRDCQDRMFVMKLIDMVKHALRVRKTKPRKENQKRINSVLNFYGHPESYQTLAVGCITFQLTGGIEAVVSEVPKIREDKYGDEAPDADEPPPLVRLCHGEAEDIINARLQRIIASMAAGDDPRIEVGATTGVILAVSMELILRMRRYQEYPFKLCLLSKTHCPDKHLTHINEFLNLPDERLDVGCGLEIRKEAWKCGNETAATNWLLSDPVQAMLDRLVEVILTNSLEAERRHAQIKKVGGV